MIRMVSTDTAPPPFSKYSQGVHVAGGSDLLFISGQVGVDLDGKLADTEEAQHQQTWRNLLAILAAEGMDQTNIVDVTAYVTQPSGVPIYRKVRDEMLKGAEPASTLLVISGLADPAFVVEISIVAAKKPG